MSKHNVGDLIKLVTEEEFDEHKADYIHHAGYGAASGTNAKTITLNPKPTSYKEGMTVAFMNVTQNSGAVTINVNGLGAKTILKSNGNALTGSNLKANSVYTVRYNGTNFILQGEGGEYGTAQASDVLRPKTVGTENGIVTGTMVDRGTVNQTLTTQGGSTSIPAGYYSGGNVKAQFTNLVAENIKKGVNIGGVVGNQLTSTANFISSIGVPTGDVIVLHSKSNSETRDSTSGITRVLYSVSCLSSGVITVRMHGTCGGSDSFANSSGDLYVNGVRRVAMSISSSWYDTYTFQGSTYDKVDKGQSDPTRTAVHFANITVKEGDVLKAEHYFKNDNGFGNSGSGSISIGLLCGNGNNSYFEGLIS